MTGEIKIFRVGDYGDYLAGRSPEEVKQHYLRETGIGDEEVFEELSDEQVQSLMLATTEAPDAPRITFRDALDEMIAAKTIFPVIFAGSE